MGIKKMDTGCFGLFEFFGRREIPRERESSSVELLPGWFVEKAKSRAVGLEQCTERASMTTGAPASSRLLRRKVHLLLHFLGYCSSSSFITALLS